jgi:hypothetical protein
VRALVVLVWLVPTFAFADADNRPQDRFSFALSVSNATRGEAEGVGSPVDALSGIGWETSYWPNDYFGIAYDFEYLRIPTDDPGMAAIRQSTNTGLGGSAVVAIPLRYVQPYAGVWAGLRYNFVNGDSRGVNPTLAPRAGLNIYVNRNLRFFAQWESVPLESDAMSDRGNVVSVGARWSPDVFHRQRALTKFSAVWGFAAMSVGLWAISSAVAGN